MSNSITGTHLKSEDLDDNVQKPLIHFGDWVAKAEFVPLRRSTNVRIKTGTDNSHLSLRRYLTTFVLQVIGLSKNIFNAQ